MGGPDAVESRNRKAGAVPIPVHDQLQWASLLP